MQLRGGAPVTWQRTVLPNSVRVPLEGVAGPMLDVEVVMRQGTALISGLTLQSWTSSQGSAAILYDWQSSQLEVRRLCHLTRSRCAVVSIHGIQYQ
jgi:hypothetical protein